MKRGILKKRANVVYDEKYEYTTNGFAGMSDEEIVDFFNAIFKQMVEESNKDVEVDYSFEFSQK